MTGRRRVVVLGATGSIGAQALEVVQASLGGEDPLELVGISAATSWQPLLAQASAFGVRHTMIDDPLAATAARDSLRGASVDLTVMDTVDALLDVTQPDLVLNAVVGYAGLTATVAALERGLDVALANKESLVAAGNLCIALSEDHGGRLIPVDSEHSALLQCLGDSDPDEIDSLVLTASGGPFRGRTRAELRDVTVEQALDHPTWAMGGKITIDSATLMNKGLELIEAMVLFGVDEDEVETVVHPDSIVHALVRHRDGSLLAHLGWPDMRVPIAYALHYPTRPLVARARDLDLTQMPPLVFELPDLETFRCLALSREAARIGGGTPCVLNAANEVAVQAFLDGRIGFLSIAEVVERVLEGIDASAEPDSFGHVRAIDLQARDLADDTVVKLTS